MISDLMLSFFLVAPSCVAVLIADQQAHPLARRPMFWGGGVFSLVVALALIPALICDGGLVGNFTACVGGTSTQQVFTRLEPVIRLILLSYVLVAPLAVAVIFALNWTAERAIGRGRLKSNRRRS